MQSFREQVREHVSDHGVEGTVKILLQLSRMTVICFVCLRSKVLSSHLMCDLEKFQAKPHSSRNLIASTIRKGTEVSLRQLEKEARKEFDIAKSAEIQSWLRYEAVTAALRSQYHHRDIMRMRWVLRDKESGKPKARLVIIGYHDPRPPTPLG